MEDSNTKSFWPNRKISTLFTLICNSVNRQDTKERTFGLSIPTAKKQKSAKLLSTGQNSIKHTPLCTLTEQSAKTTVAIYKRKEDKNSSNTEYFHFSHTYQSLSIKCQDINFDDNFFYFSTKKDCIAIVPNNVSNIFTLQDSITTCTKSGGRGSLESPCLVT